MTSNQPLAIAAAIDTDALVNLLALDSLHEVLACLGFSEASCYRLPNVVAQLERARWVGDKWPKASRSGMAALAKRLRVLPPPTNLETQELLNGIDGIDEGEAFILARACEDSRLLILTGDGRMVRALHQAANAADVCKNLQGRVVVFPQLVGLLVREVSLSEMEYRWRTAAPEVSKHRHKSLSIMFGTSLPTSEDHFWTGQRSQLSNVTDVCGDDWLYLL